MHIVFSVDSLKLLLCVVTFSTHLVISKIVVEAKNESGLSNNQVIVTTQRISTTTVEDSNDYDYELCSGDQFQCRPGVCISMDDFCDGTEDCSDGSDEADCSDDYDCSDFVCGDGQCIELSAKCNGIEDCSEGSDEIGCTNSSCTVGQISCGDNKCVDSINVCDGVNDCTDGSDERGCPTTEVTTTEADYPGYGATECDGDSFACDETPDYGHVCINFRYKCDGIANCDDGTDEANCSSPQISSAQTSSAITTRSSFSSTVRGSITASPIQSTTKPSGMCGQDSFRCDDGTCIDNANVCDGQNDCTDRSDEVGCATASYSAIMSAITTERSPNYCDHEGSTYAENEDIEGDECGGLRCGSSGNVFVWTDPTCSALSAKLNSLMLGLLTAYGLFHVWR